MGFSKKVNDFLVCNQFGGWASQEYSQDKMGAAVRPSLIQWQWLTVAWFFFLKKTGNSENMLCPEPPQMTDLFGRLDFKTSKRKIRYFLWHGSEWDQPVE